MYLLVGQRIGFLIPQHSRADDDKLSDVEDYCDESADAIIDMRLKSVGKKNIKDLYEDPEKVTRSVSR